VFWKTPHAAKSIPRISDAGAVPACLSAAQVETARKLYAARTVLGAPDLPRHGAGQRVGRGYRGWTAAARHRPRPSATWCSKIRRGITGSFQIERDVGCAEKAGPHAQRVGSQLEAVLCARRKLIHYHGWSDPRIQPGFSVDYYKNVLKALGGAAKVQASYRLCMAPGTGHCAGGEGPSSLDMLSALETWVEQGTEARPCPPSRVRAARWTGRGRCAPFSSSHSLQRSGPLRRCGEFGVTGAVSPLCYHKKQLPR
jgi:hypothetical protein